MITYPLYNLCLALAAPMARVYLRFSPGRRPLLGRFEAPPFRSDTAPLWIQACSVGEVNTVRPLLEALHTRFPEIPLVLSVSTVQGKTLARETIEGAGLAWFPFDTRRAVRAFLGAVRPRALILVETEIWPNVLRETQRAGLPAVAVNGRLSDKAWPRYQRYQRWLRPVFEQLSAVGAQNAAYAKRFEACGVPGCRITLTGNTKFDAVKTAVSPDVKQRFRRDCGLGGDNALLVFGSARPGDEALAAACWAVLRERFPKLRLAIAPRHIERAELVRRAFDEPVHRRSLGRLGEAEASARIIVVDTLGELVPFYAIAAAAVVGGSFFPGVNGHNPLEPAALGVPTVFGPYMSNFPEPARVLLEARGAEQVAGPEALLPRLESLLSDPAEQRHMGTRARRAVLDNQGAIDRTVDLIAQVLAASP